MIHPSSHPAALAKLLLHPRNPRVSLTSILLSSHRISNPSAMLTAFNEPFSILEAAPGSITVRFAILMRNFSLAIRMSTRSEMRATL
jgi:hypothetical protein